MRPDQLPIKALLWRTLTPAIVIVAVVLSALVYSRLYDTILDGFSRKLVTTSALTGALIDPADHDALIAAARPGVDAEAIEVGEVYARSVAPLRRIKRELELTYVYTQVLGGSRDIVYVLDATEGAEHSPIGSEDDMTDETLAGLKAATRDGSVYVSPIEFQEQWGLLKTAAAPVLGRDGRVASTAGADVNISVIDVATQNALFESALIGLASLAASALVTLLILRLVAAPIERLKAEALRIAAGDPAPPAAAAGPREVARLRKALGDLADQLTAAMRAAWSDTLARDRARNGETLEAALRAEAGEGPVRLVDGVIWNGTDDDAEGLLRRRAMQQLAERFAADPELAARWRDFVELDETVEAAR